MQIALRPQADYSISTTVPTQPLALGALYLRTARDVARDARMDPASVSDRALVSGAAVARRAADQLERAVARVPAQHPLEAARFARAGAELLLTASRARGAEFAALTTLELIRELAGRAEEAFGRAFDLIDGA